MILEGSGGEDIAFTYDDGQGRRRKRRHPFEGVIPNLTRRYRETGLSMVREELAKFLGQTPCPGCGGTRLTLAARHVLVGGRSLPEVTAMPVAAVLRFFESLKIEGHKGQIAVKVLKEVKQRPRFLVDVGLEYLTLDRSADTLSGGEAQRIRLASQIGAGLAGVMYVLDEPSIGAPPARQPAPARHPDPAPRPRQHRHRGGARRGGHLGGDHVVDMGPGAGVHGGRVMVQGPPDVVARHAQSVTGQYLSGRRAIPIPVPAEIDGWARTGALLGASGNNLKDIDVTFPTGLLSCVTGVSGSGKSTLVNDTLYRIAARRFHHSGEDPKPYRGIEGLEWLDKVVDINQSPIGRTPRSNPATYTGLFTPSAICSPRPPRRARAATRRGASASTCAGGAARPARATA